eukprot:Hpha_TRINITY_DN4697_c0_g1::TRINITY_DN4697_c0_g1_i1::g.97204::m.97204
MVSIPRVNALLLLTCCLVPRAVSGGLLRGFGSGGSSRSAEHKILVGRACGECFPSRPKNIAPIECVGCGVMIRRGAAVSRPFVLKIGGSSDSPSSFEGHTGWTSDWDKDGNWIVDTFAGNGAVKVSTADLEPIPSPPTKDLPVCWVVAGVEGTGHHALDALMQAMNKDSSEVRQTIWRTGKDNGKHEFVGLPVALMDANAYPVDYRSLIPRDDRRVIERRFASAIDRVRRENPDAKVLDMHMVNSYPAGLHKTAAQNHGWGPWITRMGNERVFRGRSVAAMVHRWTPGYRPDLTLIARAAEGRCHLRVLALRRNWVDTVATMVLRRDRVPIRVQTKTLETELMVLSAQLKALRPEQYAIIDYERLMDSNERLLPDLMKFICVPQFQKLAAATGKSILRRRKYSNRTTAANLGQFNAVERRYIEGYLSDQERQEMLWPALWDRTHELAAVTPVCGK